MTVRDDAIAGNDALHRAQMTLCCDTLRDRVLDLLDTIRWRDAAVRIDIKRGLHRGVVMERHGLSDAAYEQLAGQVRAGA